MNAITNRNNAVESTTQMPAMASPNTNPMLVADPTVAREVATVQGQMIIAKMYPRNLDNVYKKVEASCSRLTLAQNSTYIFSRGGTEISGASIRLAEAIITAYGNAKAGYEVVSQEKEQSVVRAYAFDMESNTLVERTFTVSHYRVARGSKTLLTDPRDIYEMVANQSSRRLRACILEIIPSDIVEYALDLCNKTVANNVNITPETINQLLNAFAPFGVTRPQIEDWLQRKVEAITAGQYIRLKDIYVSLREGMGKVDDFFKSLDEINAKNASKKPRGETTAPAPENAPQPANSSSPAPTAPEAEEEVPSFDF